MSSKITYYLPNRVGKSVSIEVWASVDPRVNDTITFEFPDHGTRSYRARNVEHQVIVFTPDLEVRDLTAGGTTAAVEIELEEL